LLFDPSSSTNVPVGTVQIAQDEDIVLAAEFGMTTGNLGVSELNGASRDPAHNGDVLEKVEAFALIVSLDDEQ
jgi:hypothetical protein